MKGIHESIFMSSLRAFCVTLCGALGLIVVLIALSIAYYSVYKAVEDESYPSKFKLLPDAHGSRKELSSSEPVLLQITFHGEIGASKLAAKDIEEILLDSKEDIFKERPVKGILLVINSPGGSVNDSDIIYHLIKEYKERYHVPVFAYAEGLCASGGYYIACAADKIYASDVSLVGSIGVLSWPPFVNVVDALEKIGVNALTLSAGIGKDEMNPFRTWKPDEQKQYQSLLDFYYHRFVEIVSSERPVDKEHIIHTLGAKVYPAPEALNLGLIDQCCSTRSQALTDLAKAAKIEGKYQVVGYESSSWWKKWLKEEPASPLLTGKIKHELALPSYKGNPMSYIFVP